MKKETLYLDTSVPSAYYDSMVKDRQEATIKFWKEVLPDYQAYISEVTIDELEDTKEEILRKDFRKLVKGVFPERYINDALHVAVASFYEISYVVSWNFEHLVKVKTRRWVNSINILEGFQVIEIVSPQEL